MLRYATRIGTYSYPNRAGMEVRLEKEAMVAESATASAMRASFGIRDRIRSITLKGQLMTPGRVEDHPRVLRQMQEEFERAHRARCGS